LLLQKGAATPEKKHKGKGGLNLCGLMAGTVGDRQVFAMSKLKFLLLKLPVCLASIPTS